MRRQWGLLAAGLAMLWVFAGAAGADLCPKCKGKVYIGNIGKCVECGGPTSSGAFKLCRKCSTKLGQCEHCRAPLKGGPAAKTIELDEKANATTVAATVGQLIIVRLRGNPTTGYSWYLKEIEGEAIEQVGKVKYVPRKVPRGIVGSGGTFVATFRAAKPGEAAVLMVYVRPWEKKKPPIRTFKLAVEVADPKKK